MLFEINRSLTGMRIEVYTNPEHAPGTRWTDEMARRLGRLGVRRVTIYSSTIVAEAPDWSGLREQAEEVIRELYVYYREGQVAGAAAEGGPTAESELAGEASAAS